MGWVRPDDVLKRVEPLGTQSEFTCAFRPKNRLVVRAENDAAVKFMHDLKDLLNKHLVSQVITAGEDGFEVERMGVIDEILSIFALDLGDEDCRINFQITPNFVIKGTEGNEPDFIKALYGGLVDGFHNGVIHLQEERDDWGEVQKAHGGSPCGCGDVGSHESTSECPSALGDEEVQGDE